MKTSNKLLKSLGTGLITLITLIVFAYGFQVTQVSFEEIHSPTRQESLARVIRAIFHPDILKYETVQLAINTPVYVPCPSDGSRPPEPDKSGAYLRVTPVCTDPRTEIEVEGFNFEPFAEGQVYFIPPSEVNLGLGTFEADGEGYFKITAKVPPRPSEEIQYVRTITSKKVGSPSISQSAKDTWDKIVETVFLALLATTFGILFAIPISFFAARNLMKDITSPLSSLALSIVGWPAGIWLGAKVASWVGEQSKPLVDNAIFSLLGLLVSALIIWLGIRFAMPPEEERKPGLGLRLARLLALLVVALAFILMLYLVASLAHLAGAAMEKQGGFTGMLGNFIYALGEILALLLAVVAGVAGGGVLSSSLGRIGKMLIRPLTPSVRLVVNMALGAVAGAVLGILLGAAIDWIYQIGIATTTFWWPAGVGAALGILTALGTRKQDALPIGIVIYSITRTILNTLRAIEALIWVIIFVVWIGMGPFAGMLALGLHTIAALAKLYSEQVESIMPGPLEAIKATGATRLQTVVYGVIPQIVPLYISFTMYRWDINVRMSTIIGLAGGGGIGFLLIQNINLLNYRAASTQMVAIAIVVALMDYLSSYIRERIV